MRPEPGTSEALLGSAPAASPTLKGRAHGRRWPPPADFVCSLTFLNTMMPLVPIWIPEMRLAEAVKSQLASAGIETIQVSSLSAFMAFANACGTGVVRIGGAPPCAVGLHSGALNELRALEVRVVAISAMDSATLSRAAGFAHYLICDSDLSDLTRFVLEAAQSFWIRGLDRIVRSGWGPPVLRAAVREILASRKGLVGAPAHSRSPVRSVSQLAGRIGVSRAYLSRRASECGVSLREINDRWIILQALRARLLGLVSWDELAWRVGYRSVAGLSGLSLRVVGKGLRSLDWEVLHGEELRFEEVLRTTFSLR